MQEDTFFFFFSLSATTSSFDLALHVHIGTLITYILYCSRNTPPHPPSARISSLNESLSGWKSNSCNSSGNDTYRLYNKLNGLGKYDKGPPLWRKNNNNHASHFHSTLFPLLSHFETSLSRLENDMTRPPGTQGHAEIGFLEGQR